MSEYRGPTYPAFPNVATDPTSPTIGQCWYNTTEGVAKVYTAAGKIQFVKTGGGVYGVFPSVASDPPNPVVGQTWFNTTDGKARIKTAAGVVDFTIGTGGGGIQLDANAEGSSTNTNQLSFQITHSPNALILVWAEGAGTTAYQISSVTVGGASATRLDGPVTYCGLYYIFRSTGGTETVVVTWAGTMSGFVLALASAYKGTKSISPFFEGTSVGATYGSPGADGTVNLNLSIALGTLGRWIYSALTGTNYVPSGTAPLPSTTLDSALSEIDNVTQAATKYSGQARCGYKVQQAALSVTHSASGSYTVRLTGIITAILPA